MTIAPGVKNKFGFVDGTFSKPVSTNPMHVHWIRCDMMVLSMVVNSLSPEIASSVLYVNSTKEMWNELKERFFESNGPHNFQLQRSISSLVQGQLTVSAYFTNTELLLI